MMLLFFPGVSQESNSRRSSLELPENRIKMLFTHILKALVSSDIDW